MNGGTLTNRQGHLLHVTNTNAIITLNGVKLVNDDHANVLLSVCADGWQGAANKATFNAANQQLEGTILVGSDSELALTLTDGSTFTGCIDGNITNAAGKTISTETGKVDVTLGDGCTWNLTADTYITSFTGDASQIVDCYLGAEYPYWSGQEGGLDGTHDWSQRRCLDTRSSRICFGIGIDGLLPQGNEKRSAKICAVRQECMEYQWRRSDR
jgi:hypothetical protein